MDRKIKRRNKVAKDLLVDRRKQYTEKVVQNKTKKKKKFRKDLVLKDEWKDD